MDLLLAFGYCSLSVVSAAAVIAGSWLVGVAALVGGVLIVIEIVQRFTRAG
jgi:hypothetical protein